MKFGDRMTRMDFWILWKFMRLSYWVDWRFHVNQYRLSAHILSGGLAMYVANAANSIIHNWRLGIIVGGCAVFIVWSYWRNLEHLKLASAAYERNPTSIPQAAHYFIWFPGWARLPCFFMALAIWAMFGLLPLAGYSAYLIAQAITGGWMVLIMVAFYIAAGIPSGRERRKKKVRAPWGARPVTRGA